MYNILLFLHDCKVAFEMFSALWNLKLNGWYYTVLYDIVGGLTVKDH